MSERIAISKLDRPAVIIETATPVITDANTAGRVLWGLSPSSAMPIALDPAMPALQELQQRQQAATDQPIVFWTNKGAQRLRCTAQLIAEPDTVLVVFSDAPPRAATVPPTHHRTNQAPAPNEHVDLQTMAHELRTPIGSIIAFAEMIEHQPFGPIGDPRYAAYARDIGHSARLSLNIVASALRRDTDNQAVLQGGFTELNIRDSIEMNLRTVAHAAEQAGITLKSEIPPGLPNLISNAPALAQILLNLLSNAIKFTGWGGSVTVGAHVADDGGIAISVEDTGIGMSSVDVEILVSGTAPDSSPANATGDRSQGIGFSVVRGLAMALTAEFDVASTRGVGTRVTLTFPPAKTIPVATPYKPT